MHEIKVEYSADEERVNMITHLLGVIFIIFGGYALLNGVSDLAPLHLGLLVYIVTFGAVFLASSVYHSPFLQSQQRQLRKLDHIAIYFFIAGTNTPFLLGFTESTFSNYFLISMWMLVAIGTMIKWLEWHLPDWLSLLFYLFMGWLGVVTIYLVYPSVSGVCILLVILGGLLYTIGAYFYRHDHRKWYHSVWHIFVLAAAVSHFAAIYWEVAMV